MKAARFYGPGDIRIDEVDEPATRPGTVKVEVEWCGICGTDLHEYVEGPIFAPTAQAPHPLTGESVPITLGHEFAGVVAELGDGVTSVAVGDRVVVEPYIICGRCDPCRSGRYNVCQTLGFVGLSGYGGGFSQYVVAEERWIPPAGRARHRRRRADRAPGRRLPRGEAVAGPVRSGWSPPRPSRRRASSR